MPVAAAGFGHVLGHSGEPVSSTADGAFELFVAGRGLDPSAWRTLSEGYYQRTGVAPDDLDTTSVNETAPGQWQVTGTCKPPG